MHVNVRGYGGFLRFPECHFLLHGVEHSVHVAILSPALVWETDTCRLFLFICIFHTIYNLLCTFFK